MKKNSVRRFVLDEAVMEPLVGRALDGDKRARTDLWLALAPVIEKIAGHWRVTSRLHDREDERRNVVVCVMARLEAKERERLRAFHELLRRRSGAASEWFGVLVVRAALRYTAAHPERLGSGTKEDPWGWVDLEPLPDGMEERMLPEPVRVIDTIEAHEIMTYAERALPPRQVSALRLWAADCSDAEIAAALGLPDADAACKLVRRAKKHLRTRFAGKPGDEAGQAGEEEEEFIFEPR